MLNVAIKIYLILIVIIECCHSMPKNQNRPLLYQINRKSVSLYKNYANEKPKTNELLRNDNIEKNYNFLELPVDPKPGSFYSSMDIDTPCPDGQSNCRINHHQSDDIIDKIIANSKISYKTFIENDNLDNKIDLGPRFNEDITPLCMSYRQKIAPNLGRNKMNNWITIVNTEKNQQYIDTEICGNPDKPCGNSDPIMPGYEHTCRQFFSFRKVLAVNDTDPYLEEINVASCCKCVITKN